MNEKRTDYGCGIGCVTGLVLYVIGIIVLVIIVYREPPEKYAIDYIIEHIDELRGDINDMGYEARVAYTLGDIVGEDFEESENWTRQTKLGDEDRGILILTNGNEQYRFDIGFDYYKTYINDGKTFLSISKNNEDEVLDLNEKSGNYPVYVTVDNEEIDNYWISSLWNDYNIGFTEAREVGLHGVQKQADSWIKKYFSAEELREIYERCIGLQEQLVELYEAKKG